MKGAALFLILISALSAFSQNAGIAERISAVSAKFSNPSHGHRESGTMDEMNAAVEIMLRMKLAGLEPAGRNNNYFQAFPFWQINKREGFLKVNHKDYENGRDFYIMPFSGSGKMEGFGLVTSQARDLRGKIAIINNFTSEDPSSDSFLRDALEQAKRAEKQGAAGVILTHFEHAGFQNLNFGQFTDTLKIPVLLAGGMVIKQSTDASAMQIEMQVNITREERVGYNVLGKINHKAGRTGLLVSHYDGPAGSSETNQLAGLAVMLELAGELKKKKYKNSDFLFVAFSGHYKGMAGEKWFVENPLSDTSEINLILQFRHSDNGNTRIFTTQENHLIEGISTRSVKHPTVLQKSWNKPLILFSGESSTESGASGKEIPPLSPEKVYLIALDLLKMEKLLLPQTQKNGKI